MENKHKPHQLHLAIAAALSLTTISSGAALAAGEVTVVNTSTAVAADTTYTGTVDNADYKWGLGNNLLIEGFEYGGSIYSYDTVADNVQLVRVDNVNATGDQLCSVFVETTGTERNYKAAYPKHANSNSCDLEALLSGRVINRGALDLFSNFGVHAKNIERADFIFTAGITAPNAAGLSNSGHVVTEKSGNNAIKIAAILALDGSGQPSQFGALVRVTDNNPNGIEYGVTNIGNQQNDFLVNTIPGDYPEKSGDSTETLGMAFVSLSDLGVTAGSTYFGFSYFADDVVEGGAGEGGATVVLADPTTFLRNTGNPNSGDEADLYGGTAGYFTISTEKTISGKIFQDEDSNGSQNGTEAGIGSVSLSLFVDTDSSGSFEPANDQQVGASVVTNGSGEYLFSAPGDGDYFVLVDEADTELPANHTTGTNPLALTIAGQDLSDKQFPFEPEPAVDAPVATNDAATTEENQPVQINVLDNDTPQAGVLIVTIVGGEEPENGTAVVNAGIITYTPENGFDGSDSFQYQIKDSNDDISRATVSITVTPLADFDQDGIPDIVDIDDDNDGILDSVEGNFDFDGDGSVNSQDLDADGDGINDLQESGLSEADQTALDSNNDGQIDSTETFGANGLADNIETSTESGTPDYSGDGSVTTVIDTDEDTHPDFLDLDADNDGILDVIEAGFNDEDGDGEADAGQAATNSPVDTDGDLIPDYRDLDTDNDGITDIIEAGGVDSDNDGRVDGFVDANNDGYDDNLKLNPLLVPDTDGDTIANFRDLDSDNDGLTDIIEAGGEDANKDGRVDSFVDTNGDGRHDPFAAQPLPVPDTDADGIADFRDLDSDNDGIADLVEAGGVDTDGNGRVDNFVDTNKDGYDDNIAASPLPVPDTDGDNHPDYLDLDSDNDGITDLIEAGGVDTDFDGKVDNFTDANHDGMDDPLNTASGGEALPIQDTDADGLPDYRDLDSDNDGMLDIVEAGLPDADNDGKIDGFVDANGDGLDDNITAVLAASGLKDTDNNGVADFQEACNCGDGAIFRTGLEGNGGGSLGLGMLGLLGGAAMFRRRRQMALRGAASVAVLMSASFAAQAENSPSERNFDSRIYLGAGAGLTQLEPEAVCPCYRVDDDTSAGGQVFIGVDVSRSFSLEGYYADLGGAAVGKVNGESAGDVDYQVYGVSAIGYLLNSRDSSDYASGYDDEGKFRREGMSLYGRVGVGGMENSAQVKYERVEDLHLTLGVGAEYGWQNGVAARAEYISYDKDAQMLSLALLKRFGRVEEVEQVAEPEVEVKPKPAPVAPVRAVVNSDSDNDGVMNAADVCPNSPQGARVNSVGCVIDRDRDGVINEGDRCPNTPANTRVDENGCEIGAAKKVSFSGVLEGVNFRTGSDLLTEKATMILDDAAVEMNRFPGVAVVIVGHTDNQGGVAFNKDLSIRRAKAVARYLVAKGVKASRLRYAGKGESQPLTGNDTPEGRATNRRVEFFIK